MENWHMMQSHLGASRRILTNSVSIGKQSLLHAEDPTSIIMNTPNLLSCKTEAGGGFTGLKTFLPNDLIAEPQHGQLDAFQFAGLKEQYQCMAAAEWRDIISEDSHARLHGCSAGYFGEVILRNLRSTQLCLANQSNSSMVCSVDCEETNNDNFYFQSVPGLPSMNRASDDGGEKYSAKTGYTGWQSMKVFDPQICSDGLNKLKGMQNSPFDSKHLYGDEIAHFPRVCSASRHASQDSLGNVSLESSNSDWHENTEELDALLSSDEEDSTGHSPSTPRPDLEVSDEATSKKNPENFQEFAEVTSKCNFDNLQDVSSKGTGPAVVTCYRSDILEEVGETSGDHGRNSLFLSCVSGQDCGFLVGKEDCKDASAVELSDNVIQSGIVSISKDEKKDGAWPHREVLRSFSNCSVAIKKSKKERIRKMVGILRSLLFGRGYMDTAVVLNETVRCVKSLELKVKALEVRASGK